MFRISKYKCMQNVIIAIVSLSFTTAGFSAAMNSARIIPSGKVYIIEGGKVVGEFSKEGPLPEGAFLRCEAKCTVKLDDAYMVAEPDTVFSVNQMANSNELAVREGTVYFSVSKTSRPLEFSTPAGNATMREVSLSNSELNGYVRASGSEAEIGVIDGGTMKVETASGEMAITPGKQITIALIDPATSASASGSGDGSTSMADIALGVAGAGVIIAGGYLLSTTDGNRNSSKSNGSPSSP